MDWLFINPTDGIFNVRYSIGKFVKSLQQAVNRKVFLWMWLGLLGLPAYAAQDSVAYETLFIIDQLPSNTPYDASIYLASDLDGWYPDVTYRKFERNEQGQLQLLVRHTSDSIRYKVTRGKWKAAEGRDNGRALPNRFLIIKKPYEEVHLTVDSWEDIPYRSYIVYMVFLLISAVQGGLLIVAVQTFKTRQVVAKKLLTVLLSLITLSLLGRASTVDPDLFNWQPKLLFVPELILFTYAPLFYFYIKTLLGLPVRSQRIWMHFIPAAVQVATFLPFVLSDRQALIYDIMDQKLFLYFASTGIAAFVFNCFYWILTKNLIDKDRRHGNENKKKYLLFLRNVMRYKAVFLLCWLTVIVVYVVGKVTNVDLLNLSERIVDVLWLLFSFSIFSLAYYAVRHPEVLHEKKKYQDIPIKQNEVREIQDKLNQLLVKQKVFLKQDLTLEVLAHMVPTSTHTLSRIINEHYQQSFTDLINSYRIDEFIRMAKDFETRSFLELALSAGFNSKPTFNRAFKKMKGSTPRDYFKKLCIIERKISPTSK